MKSNIFRIFITSIIVLSITAYVFGLTDSAFQDVYHSENGIYYLINSVKYFVLWVLPYWWAIILGSSLVSTFLYWVFKKIVEIFRK
ncbi:hypothetical protein AMQ68_14320 [Chryseobacterium sp. ERMR1:04]|nr:hypothetical protein AMQ68_14320 [Chryseobacterium sp. ERMR1:04]